MPASTQKQARFMWADLARAKAGKKTKTGMSAEKITEFTHVAKGSPPSAGYKHLGRFATGKPRREATSFQ